MSFGRRPLAPGDARQWAALLTAIQDADGGDDYPGEQDLQEAFGHPGQDFANGSIAIRDGRAMVGYGVLTCRTEADPAHNMRYEGGVHPSYRRSRVWRPGYGGVPWSELFLGDGGYHRERLAGRIGP
jgi:hypothetical protein